MAGGGHLAQSGGGARRVGDGFYMRAFDCFLFLGWRTLSVNGAFASSVRCSCSPRYYLSVWLLRARRTRGPGCLAWARRYSRGRSMLSTRAFVYT